MRKLDAPSITSLLEKACKEHGDRTFIKYVKDEEIIKKTYNTVYSDAKSICRMTRDILPEKSHIAIISKSTYEYIICLTGILLSGNVAIPMAPETPAEEAAALINAADVTAVFYEEEYAGNMEAVKKLCPGISFSLNLGSREKVEEICRKYADEKYFSLSDNTETKDECSLIIYTSGTTGIRKGVMLSNNCLVANTMYNASSKETARDNDIVLSVLPLYHIFCFVADFVGGIVHGNTVCLNGSMRDLFANMLRFTPKTIRVVPMIAQAILARIKAMEKQHPEMTPAQAAALVTGGQVDWLVSGGAYLDKELCLAFEKYGIHLRQGYGMSEAGCKISVPDETISLDSVGVVMDNLDVRIRDGEIQVDTPCRMLGYYKMPEETAAMFTDDGWLKTGDIGSVSEKGELFVTGRVKNLIILSNGENVSPEGIENRYKLNKLVSEVLVYAEHDTIVAAIYPDAEYAEANGITDVYAALDEYTDRLNETALPSHTVAKLIIREEPLPKTAKGTKKRNITM